MLPLIGVDRSDLNQRDYPGGQKLRVMSDNFHAGAPSDVVFNIPLYTAMQATGRVVRKPVTNRRRGLC
jgi:hypothetical protein